MEDVWYIMTKIVYGMVYLFNVLISYKCKVDGPYIISLNGT